MRVESLGDAAFVVRDLRAPAYLVADALRSMDGVLDSNAAYETVGIYTEPCALTADELEQVLQSLEISRDGLTRAHKIPVCYEMGEDLADVSGRLGVSEERVVELHTGRAYDCFAVGFCPGFPYLGWLPEEIAGVPRRASPRTRVEPGSVGVTGRQTGVYPLPTPGGWALIGRTPLILVDAHDGYFPIQAGDRVRFHSISREEFERLKGERL